jgi:hypothetical protein
MRSDMSKVIVERPRLGSRAPNDNKGEVKFRQKARDNDDLLPIRASTARRRRSNYKHLNEYLAPLRRFLYSNLGKHWDKVYAEIRSQISPNNAVQMHIMQHLWHYVEIDVKSWPDGAFTTSDGKPLNSPLFVHPKTGRLMETRQRDLWSFRRRRVQVELPAKYVNIDGRRFRELDGIWYEVDLLAASPPPRARHPETLKISAPVDPRTTRPSPMVYDVVLRDWPTLEQLSDAHGWGECGGYVYAASKRQLGSREIKKYKLRPVETEIPASQRRR